MPAAKFTSDGGTVKRVKVSVFLHPQLHRRIKREAARREISISDLLASAAAAITNWKRET